MAMVRPHAFGIPCTATFRRAAAASIDPVLTVSAILSQPVERLDILGAKLAFDRLVDPSVDEGWVRVEIDRLLRIARRLAGHDPSPEQLLGALRHLLYDDGPWNDHRPFAYDHDDTEGRRISGKLLHNYLASRRGQCVSMPALFLILAERLGLDVALASAPEHLFVQYRAEGGRAVNLETTSGGHPARTEWIRQQFPISDQAIDRGVYLRALSKREAIATLALVVVDAAVERQDWDEVINLCTTVIETNPREVIAMVTMGTAYGIMFEQFLREHPLGTFLSSSERSYAAMLMNGNRRWIEAAEVLGWVADDDSGGERGPSDGIDEASLQKGNAEYVR
jgi:regulator of sirC expression with transglutaminase-like and TPR domain